MTKSARYEKMATNLSEILDETRQELKEHGTTQFPVAAYTEDLVSEPIYWHWHKEWEIGVVIEGEGIYALDNKQYRLKKGDCFVANSEVLHAGWPSGQTEDALMHVNVFHPRIVGGSIETVFWQKYVLPMMENKSFRSVVLVDDDPNKETLASLIEAVWQHCQDKEVGYEFAVRNALSDLMLLVYKLYKEEPGYVSAKVTRDEARIKSMMTYIHEHYGEDISLSQLADCARISESECLRCFKRVIGMSPIQYVKYHRIQNAKILLANTTEKIVNIGIQCGFQDMSYFSKTFQQECGCTPSEYRKNMNNER